METSEEFIKRKEKEFEEKKEEGIKIAIKDIDRKTKIFFVREAWTFMIQYNLNKKVFIVERLKKFTADRSKMAYPESWIEGDIEYRVGYYIVGRNGRVKNRWVWGQFCPLIPKVDFNKLIKKARDEGTIF